MIIDASSAGTRTDHDPAVLPHPGREPGRHRDGRAPADPRACSACPHAADAHDGLGIRFCAATTAGGHHRGCICSAGTPRSG